MLLYAYYGFWWAALACEATFLWCLFRSGISRRHQFCIWWVGLDVASSLAEMRLTGRPEDYLRVYILSCVAITALQFLSVRNIFVRRIEQYPGIGYFGRSVLLGIMGFAAVVSLLLINSDWLHAETIADRTIAVTRIFFAGFAIFLLSGMLFFNRFHVPTPSNAIAFERGAAFYFTVQALAYFLLVRIGDQELSNTINSGATFIGTVLTFSYWIFAIKASKEVLPPQPTYDAAEHARIEELNAEAVRFAKSIRGMARKG